jgi:hypothetical protein
LFNLAKKGKMITDTAGAQMMSLLQDLQEVKRLALSSCLDNTFFLTRTRRIGRCIGTIAQGDLLVGLFGINIPFVLRRKDGAFSMVSVAHVGGHQYDYISIENASGKSGLGNLGTSSSKAFTIV